MNSAHWQGLVAAVIGSMALAGCGKPAPVVPLHVGPAARPELTLVWVGRGEAEQLEKGAWQRVPAFDYEFTVEQRRFADHWESTKTLIRRHPGYDGSAGPREQVLFFRLDFSRTAGGVASTVSSSLGHGAGSTDVEFREATLTLDADVSSFAPFNAYRITQHYRYEQGDLAETVELFKKHDGAETPWVRNSEQASLFGPRRFDGAPSRLLPGRVAQARQPPARIRSTPASEPASAASHPAASPSAARCSEAPRAKSERTARPAPSSAAGSVRPGGGPAQGATAASSAQTAGSPATATGSPSSSASTRAFRLAFRSACSIWYWSASPC